MRWNPEYHQKMAVRKFRKGEKALREARELSEKAREELEHDHISAHGDLMAACDEKLGEARSLFKSREWHRAMSLFSPS